MGLRVARRTPWRSPRRGCCGSSILLRRRMQGNQSLRFSRRPHRMEVRAGRNQGFGLAKPEHSIASDYWSRGDRGCFQCTIHLAVVSPVRTPYAITRPSKFPPIRGVHGKHVMCLALMAWFSLTLSIYRPSICLPSFAAASPIGCTKARQKMVAVGQSPHQRRYRTTIPRLKRSITANRHLQSSVSPRGGCLRSRIVPAFNCPRVHTPQRWRNNLDRI